METKKNVDRAVAQFLSRLTSCPHSNTTDCPRCLARWMRQAIRENVTGRLEPPRRRGAARVALT